MNEANQKALLANLAKVSAGHPFRGRIQEVPDGEARVVHMKDVDEDGKLDWDGMVRTSITGMRRTPDWLREGDVLFMPQGTRTTAVYVENPPDDALASPFFFLVRVKRNAGILPAFLAWQINQAPAQKYFDQAAEGTLQRHVRRAELERLPIVVPPMDVQQLAVDMDRCARAEVGVYQRLIENRTRMMESVAVKILATKE